MGAAQEGERGQAAGGGQEQAQGCQAAARDHLGEEGQEGAHARAPGSDLPLIAPPLTALPLLQSAPLRVAAVPYPFTSREQYERTLAVPLGREWNTRNTFEQANKPEVHVRAGTIIQPAKFDKNAQRLLEAHEEKKQSKKEKQPQQGGGKRRGAQASKRAGSAAAASKGRKQ